MKPYYQQGLATIYNGDCREVLPWVGQMDLILTDPPYGINHPTNYRSRGRGKLARCSDYPPVYGDNAPFDPRPLLGLGVPTVLFGGNYFADKLPASSGWIVWNKKRPHRLDQSTAELAWTNFVKGVRVFDHLWNGCMKASERGENYHPTQKPVALMEWALSLRWTPPGTVLDPYMGAGSTLVAASRLERKSIGIEIEEKYCEIAARRLEKIRRLNHD